MQMKCFYIFNINKVMSLQIIEEKIELFNK